MIRTILLVIDLAISTTIALIVLLFIGLINPYGKAANMVFYSWSWLIIKISGINLQIHGKENFQASKGYIVAANHRNIFDIPIICIASKLNIRFAAKVELFKIPIFGQAITLAGMVKIDRSNKDKALEELKKTEGVIKQGVSLVIFPEGTRNKEDKGLLPFKKGAFMMSMNTNQDLLPITVNKSNKILQGLSVKPITITIHFHKPVNPATYQGKRDQFMNDVRETILSKLDD